MGKQQAIKNYLRDVELGGGWVTLEKIGDQDLLYDDELQKAGAGLNDIVRYALNNGWELYDHPEEGWALTLNR